jgi:hypothetical protein
MSTSNPTLDVTVQKGSRIFFPMAQQPLVGQGLLIVDASRSHSDIPHSVGLLWTSDQPDTETSTWQHTTFNKRQTSVPSAGIESKIPGIERPQTYALDRAATGIGRVLENAKGKRQIPSLAAGGQGTSGVRVLSKQGLEGIIQ